MVRLNPGRLCLVAALALAPAAAGAQQVGDTVPESALSGPSHPLHRGDDVVPAYLQALQSALRQHGYRPGPPTGRLDPATRHAILEYQRDAGLEPGADNAARLKETLDHISFARPPVYAGGGGPAPQPAVASPPLQHPPHLSASQDDSGPGPGSAPGGGAGDPRVTEIQQLLKAKGFEVEETGVLDTGTVNAIKAFEPGVGLPADGQVSDQLLAKLRQS